MSLINKMLQDLEQRRSEVDVAGAMQGQLRAAPDGNRIHVAWWIVLVLTLILTAVVSWLWGRQTAPTVVVTRPIVQQPQLALKLASDLSVPLPSASNNPELEKRSDVLLAVAPPPSSAVKEADVKNAPDNPVSQAVRNDSESRPAPTMPASAVAASTKPAPELSAAPARPVQAQAAVATPAAARTAKDEPATPALKASEFDIPANVSKQIKELTPQQRAEHEYRRATMLIQQAKAAEAISALEQALQLDPHHSMARQTLVGVLLESRRQEEAIRKLQDGINLDRTQPGLAMMLARLQVDKGELRTAIETLQRTLPYAAERADYQAFLAALFQRETRHKDAIEHYSLALRRAPQNGLWWMGLGISLQAENRLPEARDAFARAKTANSLSPELLAFVEQKLNQLR